MNRMGSTRSVRVYTAALLLFLGSLLLSHEDIAPAMPAPATTKASIVDAGDRAKLTARWAYAKFSAPYLFNENASYRVVSITKNGTTDSGWKDVPIGGGESGIIVSSSPTAGSIQMDGATPIMDGKNDIAVEFRISGKVAGQEFTWALYQEASITKGAPLIKRNDFTVQKPPMMTTIPAPTAPPLPQEAPLP